MLVVCFLCMICCGMCALHEDHRIVHSSTMGNTRGKRSVHKGANACAITVVLVRRDVNRRRSTYQEQKLGG